MVHHLPTCHCCHLLLNMSQVIPKLSVAFSLVYPHGVHCTTQSIHRINGHILLGLIKAPELFDVLLYSFLAPFHPFLPILDRLQLLQD